MSVRAKMLCGGAVQGAHGAECYFNAVYEGSTELQAISENAIFGEATPNGHLSIAGQFDTNLFQQNEEYYVDLWRTENGNRGQTRPPLMVLASRLVYRSAFNPNYPKNPISFRYAIEAAFSRDASLSGQLTLGVSNPQAIGEMDGMGSDVNLTLLLARGRRSDAEIALRDQLVEHTREQFAKNDRLTDEERELYLKPYVRKLAIAKGEL